MKKTIICFFYSLSIVILIACTSPIADDTDKLSILEIYNKAKIVSAKLDSVHSRIIYDEFSEELGGESVHILFDMDSKAIFHPFTMHQTTPLNVDGVDTWTMEIYKINDHAFVRDLGKTTWEELTSGSIAELFGAMVTQVNPKLNYELFDSFTEDIEMKLENDAYILSLSIPNEQYGTLLQIVHDYDNGIEVVGSNEDLVKMDLEIVIDKNSFQTTHFKMASEKTTSMDGVINRTVETIEANYSDFNEIEIIKVPYELTVNE